MTLPYDFFIDALGFNTKISKDTPYERATAQFRKEQLDSSQTVGDQSLTGWWTRGQLSFHRGAGLNYYEVLDGETVYNRYKDSEDVSVFEPGQVTLAPKLSALGIAALDAVPAPLAGGGGIYALTSTGVKYTAGSGSSSIPTSNSAVPTSITSSGSLYYVTNANLIERQLVATESRTNHVTNPSFEAGTTGWTFVSSGAHGSMVTTTARTKYGTQSLFSNHGGWAEDHTLSHVLTGLTIGQVYAVGAWTFNLNGSGSGGIYPTILKVDSTTIGTNSSVDTWVRISGTFTATATSHTIAVKNGPGVGAGTGGSASTSGFGVDAVLFTEAPYADDYFDGSFPGCAWVGAADASKSTFATSPTGGSIVRITNSGADWVKVWWAKGRIWAVDDDGYFYALADTVATVANTNAFWNSGRTDVDWMLTDSPGSVYISDGSNIYAVTVDTDGLVPSLATPTTVSQVPLGESISSITYYLSNLVVTTTAGVRVALIQGGQVYLGPLAIEGDFSESDRAGAWNTLVYVVGRPSGRAGNYVLCAIDLSQTVTDLVYAWSPVTTLSTMASPVNGTVVSASGLLHAWSGGDTYVASRDELTASGSLTTAFIRFGTLELKHFASVLVRVGGDGGSIEAFRVDADGTETSLGTVAYNVSSTELDLGLTAPAERVALKFVLTGDTDATKAPTLLGYQLKALPVPKRQRMIRVPLMLLNEESNRSGQRIATDAFTRLQALEALEESNAVVTFEDKETGETGTAYIEAIEVSRRAPAARGKDGFGGLIYVTLRRV